MHVNNVQMIYFKCYSEFAYWCQENDFLWYGITNNCSKIITLLFKYIDTNNLCNSALYKYKFNPLEMLPLKCGKQNTNGWDGFRVLNSDQQRWQPSVQKRHV